MKNRIYDELSSIDIENLISIKKSISVIKNYIFFLIKKDDTMGLLNSVRGIKTYLDEKKSTFLDVSSKDYIKWLKVKKDVLYLLSVCESHLRGK